MSTTLYEMKVEKTVDDTQWHMVDTRPMQSCTKLMVTNDAGSAGDLQLLWNSSLTAADQAAVIPPGRCIETPDYLVQDCVRLRGKDGYSAKAIVVVKGT